MDRYPLDKVNDANYWKSVSDLKTYANQFYPLLSRLNAYQADNMSDNQAPATINAFIWNEYVVPASGGGWAKGDWAGVRSCNFFLQRYHTVTGAESDINAYVAEIRFFRSFYYFEKMKNFGDLPWLSRDLQVDSEELFGPRTSRKVVMDSVISDLNYAIANLPENSSEGRLTKYAALAQKARACLFEGTFRKYHNLGDEAPVLRASAEAAEEIMNSNLFTLYSTGDVENDFYNLFIQDELNGNPEGIMIQRFVVDKLMHNRVRQLGEFGSGFSKDFVTSYLSKNGLPISISGQYRGDAQFADEFIDRDPRMKQTIYTRDRPYHITNEGEYQYQNVPQFDNGMCFTGYRVIKFFSPTQRDFEYSRCTLDDFTYRYGEVLINYAEAKAELGEATQDVLDKSLNLLRDRAGMPHLTAAVGFTDPDWPNWEVPVGPLINEIRRERRVELAAEGFRLDDLRRWKAGELLEQPRTYLGARDPATNDYRVLYPGKTRVWENKSYLYPLPLGELTLNPQLEQNPGWEN
ncbi:MAG: RagB/SusD family nutrient uptake outer membrane protein [Chitinophagaceae bacterium]|nr:RagB/SusD family nutrient uptake outer membrane protein [Chitinophagaceae bacterium]